LSGNEGLDRERIGGYISARFAKLRSWFSGYLQNRPKNPNIYSHFVGG
jgi:hypothetical protein